LKPEEAAAEFDAFLVQRGLDRARLTAEQGVPTMLMFYRHVRADGCSLESDSDMLLYQWGTYDWGEGEFFDLNITRQLCLNDSGEDDDIWQLQLTFKFNPTPLLRSMQQGNRWCNDLDGLEDFEKFIRSSAPFQTTATLTPARVELRYGCAG
jgi:hypothetical protein